MSHPIFHTKNFNLVINILHENCYPIEFVFGILRQRLKTLMFGNLNNVTHMDNDNLQQKNFFTFPYIPTISEKFKSITKNQNIIVSYYSLSKLNQYIKTHKDPIAHSAHNNVVYKINCKDCDASYVGQTGRQLQTRISEHKNHIKKNTQNRSVIITIP